MDFSEKVKFVRGKLFISQKDLAKELNVTFVTISRWENGKVKPSFLDEKKFEQFCEVNKINF